MKLVRWLLIGMCVAGCGAMTVHGQIMLRVVKNEGTAIKDRLYSGDYSRHTTTDTLAYVIEVTNASQVPMKDIEVKWAVLVKPRNGKQKLVEGTKTLSLGRSEKDSVETEPIQTRQAWRSSYSSYNYDVVEEVGHMVEIIVGGKTVASEIKPMDVKAKIEVQRAVGEKESAPRPVSKSKKTKTP